MSQSSRSSSLAYRIQGVIQSLLKVNGRNPIDFAGLWIRGCGVLIMV